MSSLQQVAAAVIVLDECGVFDGKSKRRKNRKIWTKSWLQQRDRFTHLNLLNFIRNDSPEDFNNYFRMSEENFNYLLQIVKPLIMKQDTVMRNAITPKARLAATLRFLATGRSFEDLKFSTIISPQALGKIIPETCKAIYKALKDEYMKFPTSSMEWKKIAKDFESMWNFPNCGGALDGKHVAINKPADEGSYFFNYKSYHSVVLLGLVDANLNFIMADVGCNGRVSDGGVIEETTFYRKLKNDTLALPKNDETVGHMNFVFVADEAFALRENILKPFPRKDLNHDKRIFNYRLSRARRCVENAFGVLAARFRIFHTTINMHPSKVDHIVMACVVLHNFLRRNNRAQYTPGSMLDRENLEDAIAIEGDWRNEQPQGRFDKIRSSRNVFYTADAYASRENYVKYFNGPGKVPFQDRMVGGQ